MKINQKPWLFWSTKFLTVFFRKNINYQMGFGHQIPVQAMTAWWRPTCTFGLMYLCYCQCLAVLSFSASKQIHFSAC